MSVVCHREDASCSKAEVRVKVGIRSYVPSVPQVRLTPGPKPPR